MKSLKVNPKVAIIGAGISGIAAGRELLKNGLTNIVIFEASDRIGGRIQTIDLEHGFIELGAQWIHGETDNSVFEFASSNNLASLSDFSVEGKGTFCNEKGQILNDDLIEEMIAFLDYQKNNMTLEECSGQTVHAYFESKFEQFLDEASGCGSLSREQTASLKDVFRWFVMFELIDNSCDSLHSLSPLSYTEWQNCGEQVDLINPLQGYQRILDSLLSFDDCSTLKLNVNDFIELQTPVKSIDFNFQSNKIVLSLPKHSEEFDHVIITCSLGFLKANIDNLFAFPLPTQKRLVIEKLGFGTMNKIFLEFDEPFWEDDEESFQIVWSGMTDEHSFRYRADDELLNEELFFPKWVYSIQSFDRVRGQPNMLMAWIGSEGALQMEQQTDKMIATVCHQVLCSIVPISKRRCTIGFPSRVFVSRWYSNPFTKGSYSNRTLEYERLQFGLRSNIEALQSPLCLEYFAYLPSQHVAQKDLHTHNYSQTPLVLFAGEATDLKYYSTTHGAFDSGVREAQRIVQFYSD